MLEQADPQSDPGLCGRAEFLIADHGFAEERYAEALEGFRRAAELLERADERFELARCLRRQGDIYLYVRRYDLALEKLFGARRIMETLQRATPRDEIERHLAHLETQVGNVLQRSGDPEQALAAFDRGLRAYERLGYAVGVAGSRLNVGNVQQDLGRLEEALASFRRVAEQAAELGATPLQIMGLTNSASALIALGRPAEALPVLEAARRLCPPDNTRSLAHNHLTRSEALLDLAQPTAAAADAEHALALALQLDDPLLQRDAHLLLARASEASARADLAVPHLHQVQALSERLLDQEKVQALANIRVAFEVEARERELALAAQREGQLLSSRSALQAALALAVALAAAAGLGLATALRRGTTIRHQQADLERAYRQVDELARTDPLTGLANRREVAERLDQEIRRSSRSGRPCSLLLVDIDHFKWINDDHGHACGDRVLIEVARRLLETLRGQDMVARWGGDEFLAMLPETPLEGALAAARNIRSVLAAAPILCGEGAPVITATVGVAQLHPDEDGHACLARADAALYRGKAGGRDRIEVDG